MTMFTLNLFISIFSVLVAFDSIWIKADDLNLTESINNLNITSANKTATNTNTTTTTTTSNDDIFVSEFEILDLSNHDGRLQNGYCCNGNWPRSGSCRDGNITCLSYWRVCIMEQALPEMKQTFYRESDLDPTATTKKPSMFNSFISKIFGSIKRSDTNIKSSLPIDYKMSPTACNVGFFTSDVISSDTFFPIRFKKPFVWKWTPESNGKTTVDRYLIVLVEIHSKNPRLEAKNRLISHQLFHYNIVQPRNETILKLWGSQWYYGNKIVRSYPKVTSKLPNRLKRRKDMFSLPFTFNPRYYQGWSSTNQPSHHHHQQQQQQQQRTVVDQLSYRFRFTLRTLARFRAEHTSDVVDNIDEMIAKWKYLNGTDRNGNEVNDRQVCPQGYQGNDCDIPICLDGCNIDQGYCEQPGQCQCRFGWTGLQCQNCMTLPGCVHGDCNRPLECRCQPGWMGLFCSNPKCKEGCHERYGYCNQPNECKCRFGWKGDNCTECVPLPGCQHGTCLKSMDCICEPGWQGLFCSTPICDEKCVNGYCEKPGECRCQTGWSGSNCSQCVRYPGCSEHGRCERPWQCLCESGWKGLLCDELDIINTTIPMNTTNWTAAATTTVTTSMPSIWPSTLTFLADQTILASKKIETIDRVLNITETTSNIDSTVP